MGMLSVFILLMWVAKCLTLTSKNQTISLSHLFDSTSGSLWQWKYPLSVYGNQWNFTSSSDPCGQNWQGIYCSNSSLVCNSSTITCNITEISLSGLGLEGTLPTAMFFDNLLTLNALDLSQNNIVGKIPGNVGLLSNLVSIDFSNNNFTGSIPSMMFRSMSNIERVNLANNRLKGEVPVIVNVSNPNIIYLDLQFNYLTGPIPSCLCSLRSLKGLSLAYNYLSSSIPLLISQLSQVQILSIRTNDLTGTLPLSLGYMSAASYLYLEENFFEGSIPENLGYLDALVYISAYNNALTGSLPLSLMFLSSLRSFTIDSNLITGTVPSFFGSLTLLQMISLYDNFLSGEIPSSFAQLRNLQTLIIRRNMLHGRPELSFNRTIQQALQLIDISFNGFSGSIPLELFGSALETISLAGNCFSGSIPIEICNSKALETISFSGMSSGKSCVHRFWYFYPASPVYARSVQGTLPSCVLTDLRNLSTLQLAGNGMAGSLAQFDYAGNLSVLDLSFNRMSGTIPYWMQLWQFSSLDLKSNKFDGMIEEMGGYHFSYSASQDGIVLDVSVNRLSGIIPLPIYHAENVVIVDGNLFSCSMKHQPPLHDPDSANYVCASNLLDISLETLSAIGCAIGSIFFIEFILCLIKFVWLGRQNVWKVFEQSFLVVLCARILSWKARADDVLSSRSASSCSLTSHPQLALFLDLMRKIRRLSVCLGAAVALVGFPLFDSLKSKYGTYELQYTWHLSGAFLSGQFPALLICSYWLLLVIILYSFFGQSSIFRREIIDFEMVSTLKRLIVSGEAGSSFQSKSWSESVSSLWTSSRFVDRLRAYGNLAGFFFINALIVITLKSVFVYALISSKTNFSGKIVLEFLLSMFDLLWGFGFVPFIVYRVPKSSITNRLVLKICLLYFNSIVAPCVAIMLTDSSCFKGLFINNTPISTSYDIEYCLVYDSGPAALGCQISSSYVTTSEFSPAYFYNYGCYSAVLTNYSPVFLLSYSFLCFISPLLSALVIQLQPHPYWKSFFPRIFWVESCFPTNRAEGTVDSPSQSSVTDLPSSRGSLGTCFCVDTKNRPRKLFQPDRVLASMLHHVLVLLTFGAMVPELGIVAALVTIVTAFQWEVLVGRYLSLAPACSDWSRTSAPETTTEAGGLPAGSDHRSPLHSADQERRLQNSVSDFDWSGGLEECCGKIYKTPAQVVWLIVYFSAVFYAFLLLDVLGDSVGWRKALWAPALVLVCPFVVLVLFQGLRAASTCVKVSHPMANLSEVSTMPDMSHNSMFADDGPCSGNVELSPKV